MTLGPAEFQRMRVDPEGKTVHFTFKCKVVEPLKLRIGDSIEFDIPMRLERIVPKVK